MLFYAFDSNSSLSNSRKSDWTQVFSVVLQVRGLPSIILMYISDWIVSVCDDSVCYWDIKNIVDKAELQNDKDRLNSWATIEGFRFKLLKFNIMQLNKETFPKEPRCINLRWNCARKYGEYQILWRYNYSELRWNKHVSSICTNANIALELLNRVARRMWRKWQTRDWCLQF